MKKNYPTKADAFAARADLEFYKKTYNPEKYGQACADYVSHVANGDPKELDLLVKDILSNFPDHEECMKMAEKIAKEAASSSSDYNHHLTYAMVLEKNGKTKQAKKTAKSALELAKEAGSGAEQVVQNFIQRLDS